MAGLEGKTSVPALADSALHARIRDQLNAEGIKLWLEPFRDENTKAVNDGEVLALASRYATELELDENDVSTCIFSLLQNAVQRLEERKVFQDTGMATIKLRYSGFDAETEGRVKTEANLKMQLELSRTTGRDLKAAIATKINIEPSRLKLISGGRVIDENLMLSMQNVKNASQIMVLSVAANHESLKEVENQWKELEDTKDSAKNLANTNSIGQFSLQVADQSGRALDLPEAEKKALAVALALHEKGKAALKAKLFSRALVFLLEADSVYNQCKSSLLDMVDNYGLLNLDIAWCYLSLQSIAELPQVERRLEKCERSLRNSYGEDMERVIALKGSTGWEAALYVRLHLLQGIASYHLGKLEKSNFYISKAEAELNRLKVSDDQLVQLISMGYEEKESRMALRATYGNVAQAVDWIVRKREEQAEIKAQEKEDQARRKLQKKLGKCSNGIAVSVQLFRQLKQMGYSPILAAESLKLSNNDLNTAIQMMADTEFSKNVVKKAITDTASQGAGPSTSVENSEISSVLLNAAQLLTSSSTQDMSTEVLQAARAALDKTFSEELLAAKVHSEEEMVQAQKAYDTLAKDTCSEEEYIDLSLSVENEYLEIYKSHLLSMKR